MLRIAICDDQTQQQKQIEVMLEAYFASRPGGGKSQVECFSDSETLLHRVEEAGSFDLYLLDILMPGLNGIDIGRKLRALGDGGEIIFLTTSNDFAADSCDIHAFFYLLKPVEEEKFFSVLDGALKN